MRLVDDDDDDAAAADFYAVTNGHYMVAPLVRVAMLMHMMARMSRMRANS